MQLFRLEGEVGFEWLKTFHASEFDGGIGGIDLNDKVHGEEKPQGSAPKKSRAAATNERKELLRNLLVDLNSRPR